MSRKRLEELWEEATALPDATESPLAIAIISEAVECGDTGRVINAASAAHSVRTVAQDCQDFAAAIEEDN